MDRRHFPVLASTQDYAKEHWPSFRMTEWTLITAGRQTKGRGRYGREWDSSVAGEIYATLVIPLLETIPPDIGALTLVVSLGIAEVLENKGFKPKIKWPNDLLLEGKKVCGVLCEIEKGVVLIGIGVNVNREAETLERIGQPATSLKATAGREFDKEEILYAITEKLALMMPLFFSEGFCPFITAYRQRIPYRVGDKISVRINQENVLGEFISVTEKGALCLRCLDGKPREFWSGEIAFS